MIYEYIHWIKTSEWDVKSGRWLIMLEVNDLKIGLLTSVDLMTMMFCRPNGHDLTSPAFFELRLFFPPLFRTSVFVCLFEAYLQDVFTRQSYVIHRSIPFDTVEFAR